MSDEPSRRLQAIVTIAIVVTTLATAAVGYLQVRAGSRSSDAGQAGQEYAVLTMSNLLQLQERAKVDYEHFLKAQEQRGQAGNAFQQSVFSGAGERALLRLVQERWQRLADKTQALTPLTPNGRDGPGEDLEFPRHFFARSTAGALRYQALQDAANETNSSWDGRAARYTAVLTLLAVAVFLFGLALAMPRRVLRVFSAVGALLLVVGVAWAGAITASSPDKVPDSAAEEFSRGEVALETASDKAGFEDAIAHFTKAIDAWPGFARAYLGRANATLSASAPQLESTLLPPEALEGVVDDLESARDHGLDNAAVREQLAASRFTLALHDRPKLFGQAVSDARAALEQAPGDPVAAYSLAVSLLGAERLDEARDAYRRAIEVTVYVDGDEKHPRKAPQFEQTWLSGALSDLEALRLAEPDLDEEIDRTKERLVASVGAGRVTEPRGNASFAQVQAQVLPTVLQWFTAGPKGYDNKKNVLSVQWYTRTGDHAWIGIPEVSGRIDPRLEPNAPRFSSRNLTSGSIPPRCTETGDYRVELYVDGRLAGDNSATVAYGSLQAFIDRALNLEVCHPKDWRLSKYVLPGFRQGLVSPDGSKGVFLMRYDLAMIPKNLRDRPTAQVTDALLQSTVRTSPFLLPGKRTGVSAPQHQSLMGLVGSTQRSFSYEGGLAYGQCGIDRRDGAAFVALVFGPQTSFAQPGGDLVPVVASLSEYRYGGSSF